jgi:hypothetical protein
VRPRESLGAPVANVVKISGVTINIFKSVNYNQCYFLEFMIFPHRRTGLSGA